MEFTIIKEEIKENLYVLMKGIGYHFWDKNLATGELGFVNPVGSGGYPRFHLFLTIKNGKLIFDLHLDQKKTSYKGSTPHSGEYGGELVEKEAERIKKVFKNL